LIISTVSCEEEEVDSVEEEIPPMPASNCNRLGSKGHSRPFSASSLDAEVVVEPSERSGESGSSGGGCPWWCNGVWRW